MKLAYIVSMFPCWSETFILNELISHRKFDVNLQILSLKKSNEQFSHNESNDFVKLTTYSKSVLSFVLLLQHIFILISNPIPYFKTLTRILFFATSNSSIKLKSLVVFWLSLAFVIKLRNSKPDHIHAHFATYPALLSWIIHQFNGIPYSFTAHAHDIYVNNDLLHIICKDAKNIVTISEFNSKLINRVTNNKYQNKIIIIRCGIDLNKFCFSPNNIDSLRGKKLSILSVGRLSGIKGYSFLLHALKLLSDQGIEFDCKIIGEGHLKHELLQLSDSLGLSGRVDFLGAKKSDEIPTYIKKADVFVLACATDHIEGHDGIPVVFMEAMAYGTPVIGTSLSGIPELIIDGRTGFCAKPEDAQSLADTIIKFTECSNIAEIVHNARNIIEHEYDVETNASKLRALFSANGGC